MAREFCPHFIDDVCLLAWHRGFQDNHRYLRCAKCQQRVSSMVNGEYESWGPSNDEPEAVKVEMEAARIATDFRTVGQLMAFPGDLTDTGHLATEIATHDYKTHGADQ